MSWLNELKYELVLWLGRVRCVLVPRVIGIAQEVCFRQQPKTRSLDLLAQKRLLNTMQGARFGNASTGPASMIGDHIETAGFQRAEHRTVHCRAVDAHIPKIVIIEHQGHEIDVTHCKLRWHRILE